jgi:hypothetical protein
MEMNGVGGGGFGGGMPAVGGFDGAGMSGGAPQAATGGDSPAGLSGMFNKDTFCAAGGG